MAEDVPRCLQEFVNDRRGWTLRTDRDETYAGRIFTYPSGEKALLSLLPMNIRYGMYTAQINLAFAAGPEDQIDGRFGDCVEWIVRMEQVLGVPGRLAECRTVAQARTIVEAVKLRDLLLLCGVLEIRAAGSEGSIQDQIVRHCGVRLPNRKSVRS